MRISLDTSDPEEIKAANDALKAEGWQLDKVTTNPTTMAAAIRTGKYGSTPYDVFCYIRDLGIQEISVETLGTQNYNPDNMSAERFFEEGRAVYHWDPAIVKVKVPAVPEGIKAIRWLSEIGIPVNATLIFQPEQALWAAWAGAEYASPFVGRLDDIGENGMQLVGKIIQLYRQMPYATKVLTASTRKHEHIKLAYGFGSDIVTMPWKVFEQCNARELAEYGRSGVSVRRQSNSKPFGEMEDAHFSHQLIEEGVKRFLDDAKSVGYIVK